MTKLRIPKAVMKFLVREAVHTDIPTIDRLVNSAYRGESSKVGWTTEADILGGQRIDTDRIAEVLADPAQKILCLENEAGQILSVVNLRRFAKADREGCYLGMLTVDPGQQAGGIGRQMMAEAEGVARKWGATFMRLTVIQMRPELMAWYERRGYQKTGEIEAFPYGDVRFGEPKRDDLHFVVFEKPFV